MRIAIAGPPGSGKSTVCSLVAKKMGYELVLVGQIFRQLAAERKIDLAVFNRMAQEDETIDRELDKRMVSLAKAKQDIVIEGRLPGILLKIQKVPCLAVFIHADEKVRAERIAQREQKPVEQVLRENISRENSERKRYKAYYGVDARDRSYYDVWVDSSSISAEDVSDIIVQEARARDAEAARQG